MHDSRGAKTVENTCKGAVLVLIFVSSLIAYASGPVPEAITALAHAHDRFWCIGCCNDVAAACEARRLQLKMAACYNQAYKFVCNRERPRGPELDCSNSESFCTQCDTLGLCTPQQTCVALQVSLLQLLGAPS